MKIFLAISLPRRMTRQLCIKTCFCLLFGVFAFGAAAPSLAQSNVCDEIEVQIYQIEHTPGMTIDDPGKCCVSVKLRNVGYGGAYTLVQDHEIQITTSGLNSEFLTWNTSAIYDFDPLQSSPNILTLVRNATPIIPLAELSSVHVGEFCVPFGYDGDFVIEYDVEDHQGNVAPCTTTISQDEACDLEDQCCKSFYATITEVECPGNPTGCCADVTVVLHNSQEPCNSAIGSIYVNGIFIQNTSALALQNPVTMAVLDCSGWCNPTSSATIELRTSDGSEVVCSIDMPDCPTDPGGGGQKRALSMSPDMDVDLTAYPNPASDDVTIRYMLPAASEVRLELMDALGAILKVQSAGRGRQGVNRWNVTTADLAAGLYYVRLWVYERMYSAPVNILR